VPQDEFWEGTMKLRLPRRHFLHLAASATALPIMPHIATAQAYPTRPITMVVPFPPGGPVDTIGRIVADRMKVSLDQPIVIENVPGASGSIGVARAVRAAPDGYTLSIGSSGSHLFTGAVYALPWDLLKDLEPVVLLAGEPQLILGKKTMPATDLRELVAWLKANPDRASAGTQGVGSVGHMDGIFFSKDDRYSISIRPLPRVWAGHPGFDGGAN
jgi:tripartite-type tricarboxylate transporter receptor subunit TctC